jgi:hypothetical protein
MIMDIMDVVMIARNFVKIRVTSIDVGGPLKESGVMGDWQRLTRTSDRLWDGWIF